jgi:PAS domain S-box-containing protein
MPAFECAPEVDTCPVQVLIVDDDLNQATLVKDFLEVSGGFTINWVNCIQDLWRYLANHQPEIILLDYRLPDGTGLEALEELNKRGSRIPVIIVTGQGDERLAVRALHLGAVDYLVKGSDYVFSLPAIIHKTIKALQLQKSIEETREKNRYYALLLNNVRDAIVVWDTNGIITYWNPAASNLFGYPIQERLGQPAAEKYLSCFTPPITNPQGEATAGQEVSRLYKNENGSSVWVSSRINALRDYGANSKLIGFMDVSRDITSRVKAEKALRAERNFVATVLDTVGALVVVLDTGGQIVRSNRAFEEITGYTSNDLRGRVFWETFIPVEETESFKAAFFSIDKTGPRTACETQLFVRDGSRRTIAWSNTVILNANKRAEFFIATGIDLTEKKIAEEAAQVHLTNSARLSAIGELASGVAHHINNPLTAIIAEAQILQHTLPESHPAHESVDIIQKAGWRVQKAVQQLLDFSRPATTTLTSLSINETIETALTLVGEHIQSFGIRLETDLAGDLPSVRGNLRQLVDLWINLLLLARDASGDGKEHSIFIRSQNDGGGVIHVEIGDDGETIPPEEMQTLFEPNFIKPIGGRGTGIELSICQEIIRQHFGKIEATSSRDEGTVFRLTFPSDETSRPNLLTAASDSKLWR